MNTREIIKSNSSLDERGVRQIAIDALLFRSWGALDRSHRENASTALSLDARAEKIAVLEMESIEWANAAHNLAVDLSYDINRVANNFVTQQQKAKAVKKAFIDSDKLVELGLSKTTAEKYAAEGVPVHVLDNFEGIKEMGFSSIKLETMFKQSLKRAQAQARDHLEAAFALETPFLAEVATSVYTEDTELTEDQEYAVVSGLDRATTFQKDTVGKGLVDGWTAKFMLELRASQKETEGVNNLLKPRLEELERIREETERSGYTVKNPEEDMH